LVFGALRERDLTIKTLAPHLVGHEPFLYPLRHQWEKPYVGSGVALYDAMATMGRRTGGAPHARYLGRRAVLREAPGLDPDVVIAGLQYPDGRMDDARHTLAVARTAAAYGAHVITRAPVTGISRAADGRVTGLTAEDREGGGTFTVSAHVVVNAAGVWAAEVQRLAGANTFTVAPAKGVHLLVREEAFDSKTGILARAEDSVIILRKWYGHWLLGTTDTPYEGDPRNPTTEPEDIDYLLRNINKFLRRKIGPADLLGTYAGLRPLLAPAGPGSASTTSALSRDHAVIEAPEGMVTIVGGKYTTYRIMARDAVDAAARPLGRTLPPTPTETLPLVGAVGWRVVANQLSRLSGEYGVPEPTLRRMLHRYGDELPDVLAPIKDQGSLRVPIAGTAGYLPVEFLRAVTHEGALTLDDVLSRRTHVAIEDPDAGTRAADEVAGLVAPTLGWDETRQKEEVAAYGAQPRLTDVL
jgi:glycerol-3-phosphate dehydrogenase